MFVSIFCRRFFYLLFLLRNIFLLTIQLSSINLIEFFCETDKCCIKKKKSIHEMVTWDLLDFLLEEHIQIHWNLELSTYKKRYQYFFFFFLFYHSVFWRCIEFKNRFDYCCFSLTGDWPAAACLGWGQRTALSGVAWAQRLLVVGNFVRSSFVLAVLILCCRSFRRWECFSSETWS